MLFEKVQKQIERKIKYSNEQCNIKGCHKNTFIDFQKDVKRKI